MVGELARRINMPDIERIAREISGVEMKRWELWDCVKSHDRRVAVNALWVMSHLQESEAEWVQSLQNELIDMLLGTDDGSKKRIILQLLREQEFDPEDFRTDLLDFCFSKINSEWEPYAVRCFSIYMALKLCAPYRELINELESHIEMLDYQELSPGMKCALRKARAQILKLKKR